MIFNSVEFALFLPIVFILYWFFTQRNLKIQNWLIVVASYFFYGWWDWRFLSLIAFSSLIDYCESNDKNVFLGRSPQNDKYIGIINELSFDSIRKKEFASIPFLDFNDFELNKEDYADLEHLNFKGANKFSKWFDNYFKNNLPLK